MRDFIELVIIGIIIYWSAKFIYNKLSNTVRKRREPEVDVKAIIEEQKMKMMNTIYADEFYKRERELRSRGFGGKGIYIFTNMRTNRKYVGQSIKVLKRVRTHLRGRGNKDLYKHMKAGDKFTIQFIRLADTNFSNLNALEKHYISKYNSYTAGYNKTRGNS